MDFSSVGGVPADDKKIDFSSVGGIPADSSDKTLSGAAKHFLDDVKNAGSGIKTLATAAANYPKNLAISGAEIASGVPAGQTPVGEGVKAVGNAALEAVPHKENGEWTAGKVAQRVGELLPGTDIALDKLGIKTEDKMIGHPLDALYEHPLNTILDYSILGGAAEKGLTKAGEIAGRVGEVSKAADVAGKAAESAGLTSQLPKVGEVSDKVGVGSQVLAATSGASKSAFSQLWDDPHLLATAPKPEEAVDLVHQAAHADLPKLINDPVAKIGSDLSNGVNNLKSQYGAAVDSASKDITDSLQAVKDHVSSQYDQTLEKMGLGQSLGDWQKAVAANGLEKPNVQSLLKDFNLAKSMNDAEPTKLAALYKTRQGLDDLVDYAAQEKSGMTGKTLQKIEQTRAQVNDALYALPQAEPIKALDQQWHSVMQNRRALFQKFNSPDTAAKTLDALANGDRAQSRVLGPALQNLEQMSGKSIVQPFMQAATPLRDSITALEPHLKTPESLAKLVKSASLGEVPSLQAEALKHLDAVNGTDVIGQTQQISPLVKLERALGSKFVDPGATENTLRKIFSNPDQHKDLINAMQHLEQVTGKPIAHTVNRAMAASELGEPFNASKGNLMLRMGAPLLAGAAGKIVPAIGMIGAISPKIISTAVGGADNVEKLSEAATHASHAGAVAADVAKVGSIAAREQLMKSLKKKE